MNKKPLSSRVSHKMLFLVDGLGALVSAAMLGVVLPAIQESIGLAVEVMYMLALIPLFFSIYSFSMYFSRPANWGRWLTTIAMANLLYCILTLIILVSFYSEIKLLGYLYFIGEIIVISGLIYLEIGAVKQKFKS
jgi:Na+-driven multidrug efflux pump